MEVRDLDCVWHLLILVSPGERSYTLAIGRNFGRKKTMLIQCQNYVKPENIDIDTNIKFLCPLFTEIWGIDNPFWKLLPQPHIARFAAIATSCGSATGSLFRNGQSIYGPKWRSARSGH